MTAAQVGDYVAAGGLVRTGLESKVRLDFTEGTIVRLGASSEFAVTEMSASSADPFTRLSLFAGQLWVILNGGQLEVETPVGVAAVRGSYLGVLYDPGTQRLTVTCLEGQCSLADTNGVRVDLVNGQMSEIAGPGQPPASPQPLSQAQVAEWAAASPEALAMVPVVYPQGTPTPAPGEVRLGGGGGGAAPVANSLTATPSAGNSSAAPVAGGGPVAGGQVSTAPLKYDIGNACTESRTISYTGPEAGSFTLGPGERRTGELAPGTYTFNAEGNGSAVWNSDAGPLVGVLCEQSPGGGGGGPGTPGGPPPVANTEPLRYALNHNCPADPQTGAVREGVWEWTFQNLTTGDTYTLSLGPGESRSGELPPGRYRISDRDATGPLTSGEINSGGPGLNVNRCGG